MKKITIEIQDTPDGGLAVTMTPPAPQLMERALAGVATMAESSALAAYAKLLEVMDQATEPSALMELGQLPEVPR